MNQFEIDQIDLSADYIFHASNSLQAIARLIAASDMSDDQPSPVSKQNRIGLMTAIELIAEGLVSRSCDLRQLVKEG
ncbi:hypothetical protein SAMN05216295_10571 [Pseudomonas luteola]|uniref:hypothetical protein n=1 Tax=Pseudomonas sp. TaxID=306 RepID=UPI00091B3DE9|nr:hypothetical protein [Pseudomonas sp.]RRW48573.1 hypothetical protein EGJ50_08340 [Pseudomonas luteola]SHI92719.1 hypothetical protein SAMN05216295_10571 [Pseudomonas zeshuii]